MITLAILWEMNLGGETGSRITSQETIALVKVGSLDNGGANRTGEEKAGLKYMLKEQIENGDKWKIRDEEKEKKKDEPLTWATR